MNANAMCDTSIGYFSKTWQIVLQFAKLLFSMISQNKLTSSLQLLAFVIMWHKTET